MKKRVIRGVRASRSNPEAVRRAYAVARAFHRHLAEMRRTAGSPSPPEAPRTPTPSPSKPETKKG